MAVKNKIISCSIDLSGPHGGFALSSSGEIISSVRFDIAPRNNSIFLNFFFETISKHGIAPAEIGKWIVGIGPGSFTGLRIASSFVYGLTYGREVKTTGMPTSFPVASEALQGCSGNASILFYASLNSLIICSVHAEENKYSLEDVQLIDMDKLDPSHLTGRIAFMENHHIVEMCGKSGIDISGAMILKSFPIDRMLEIEQDKEYSIGDLIYVRPAATVLTRPN